jgi:hypothetical protein
LVDRLHELGIVGIPPDGRLHLQDFQSNVEEIEANMREFTMKFRKMGGHYTVIDFDIKGRSIAYRLGRAQTQTLTSLLRVDDYLNWAERTWLDELRVSACSIGDGDNVHFEPAHWAAWGSEVPTVLTAPWNSLMYVTSNVIF